MSKRTYSYYKKSSGYNKFYKRVKPTYYSMPQGFSGIGPQKRGAARYVVPKYIRNPNPTRGMKHERKYIDNGFAQVLHNLGGTWTFELLNGCVTGSEATTRVGREITVKSILFRGSVNAASTSTGYSMIRTVILIDWQPNATLPVTLDLFKEDSFRTMQNLDNRKRFKILWDDTRAISAPANLVNSSGTSTSDFYYFKKCNIPVEYNGIDGGSIGDITKAAIYLATVMDLGAGLGSMKVAGPITQAYARCRFTDA